MEEGLKPHDQIYSQDTKACPGCAKILPLRFFFRQIDDDVVYDEQCVYCAKVEKKLTLTEFVKIVVQVLKGTADYGSHELNVKLFGELYDLPENYLLDNREILIELIQLASKSSRYMMLEFARELATTLQKAVLNAATY